MIELSVCIPVKIQQVFRPYYLQFSVRNKAFDSCIILLENFDISLCVHGTTWFFFLKSVPILDTMVCLIFEDA